MYLSKSISKFKSSKVTKVIGLFLLCALVIVSAFLLTACENPNKTPANIKEKYEGVIRKFNTDSVKLFGDSDNQQANTIVVTYNDAAIDNKIYDNTDTDDISKRYIALSEIQANLLKYIFRYYEVWHQSFYEHATDYNQKDINKLYDMVTDFEKALNNFNNAKTVFESEIDAIGNTSAVATTINKFTFEYNKLIEYSFSFVDYFKSLHIKYVAGEDNYSLNSVQRLLSEAYFNIAKYVYYENILPLNYSTGSYGVCDQLEIMKNNNNAFVITKALNSPIKLLGENITTELTQTEFNNELTNKFANIIYTCATFNQSFAVYLSNYNLLDNTTFLKVKLQLFDGINLKDYVQNFTPLQKNSYTYNNLFLNKFFVDYKYTFNELLN